MQKSRKITKMPKNNKKLAKESNREKRGRGIRKISQI